MADTRANAPNWQAVGPEAKKKLSPLVKHYMSKPHPFTACVRDNSKRFGPERAKKVCAVVKDIGYGGTGWRKGPKKKVTEAEVEAAVRDLVEAGLETVHDVELIAAFMEREDPDLLAQRALRIEEARKSKAAGSPGKCASCGKGLPKSMKAEMKKCPHCGKALNTESDAIEEAAPARPHEKLTDAQLKSRLLRAKARVSVISGPERGQHQKLADELLAERRKRQTPARV